MIIYPDHKTTQQQRSHISYTLKLVVGRHAGERPARRTFPRFVGAFLRYSTAGGQGRGTAFTLLDAARYLPAQYFTPEMRGRVIEFAGHWTQSRNPRMETAALQFCARRSAPSGGTTPSSSGLWRLARSVPPSSLTITFLQYRILLRAGEDVSYHKHVLYDQDITSEVFLDNLKTPPTGG